MVLVNTLHLCLFMGGDHEYHKPKHHQHTSNFNMQCCSVRSVNHATSQANHCTIFGKQKQVMKFENSYPSFLPNNKDIR
jgi:hypothetical protein